MLNLTTIEFSSTPFHHFLSPSALSEHVALEVLEWLEKNVKWTLVETDFYEQFELNLCEVCLPKSISFLHEQVFLAALKRNVEVVFNAELGDRVDATVHKLIPGQRIRLHNDFIAGQETFRLLLQLNRGWEDNNGGLLLFFNSSDASDVHTVFRPLHNSAIAFAISPDSNHAVSTVHSGQRFTLVYSFYGKGCR